MCAKDCGCAPCAAAASVAAPSGAGCGPLSSLSSTMRRDRVAWEALATVCSIVGVAFTSSIFLSSIGAAFFGVQAAISTLVGGCEAGAMSRSLARQAAVHIGIVAGLFVLVFAGAAGAAISGSLAALSAALSEYASRGTLTSSTVGKVLQQGERLADAEGQGALADGFGIASRVVNAAESEASMVDKVIESGLLPLVVSAVIPPPTVEEWVLGYIESLDIVAGQVGPDADVKPLMRRQLANDELAIAEWRREMDRAPFRALAGGGLVRAQEIRMEPLREYVRQFRKVATSPASGAWTVEVVRQLLQQPTVDLARQLSPRGTVGVPIDDDTTEGGGFADLILPVGAVLAVAAFSR